MCIPRLSGAVAANPCLGTTGLKQYRAEDQIQLKPSAKTAWLLGRTSRTPEHQASDRERHSGLGRGEGGVLLFGRASLN